MIPPSPVPDPGRLRRCPFDSGAGRDGHWSRKPGDALHRPHGTAVRPQEGKDHVPLAESVPQAGGGKEDGEGHTPLHLAAAKDALAVANAFIRIGVDLNTLGNAGRRRYT